MPINIIPHILRKVEPEISTTSEISIVKLDLISGSFIIRYNPDNSYKAVNVKFKSTTTHSYETTSGTYSGKFTTGNSDEIGGNSGHSIYIGIYKNGGSSTVGTIKIPFYGSELYPSIIKANTTYSICFSIIKSYDHLIISLFCVVEGNTSKAYWLCFEANKIGIPLDFDPLAAINVNKALIKTSSNTSTVSWKRNGYHGDNIALLTRSTTFNNTGNYAVNQCIKDSDINFLSIADDNWETEDYDWVLINGYIYVKGISGSFPANRTILYKTTNNASVTPYALPENRSITSLTYSSSTNIWVMLFNGDLTSLPDMFMLGGYPSFDGGTYLDCYKLLNILYMPDTITSMGAGVFSFTCCQSYALSKNITSIPSNAFMGNAALSNITIPSNVTTIDYSAFYWCTSLYNFTIPSSVTTIGIDAFREANITNLIIPNSVTSIGAKCFYQNGVEFARIGRGLTTIPELAFYKCANLKEVLFLGSDTWGVQTIGDNAFTESGLESLLLPASLVYTGRDCFANCKNLISVLICKKIQTLGRGTFYGCSNLQYFTYEGTSTEWGQVERLVYWHEYCPASLIYCMGDSTYAPL